MVSCSWMYPSCTSSLQATNSPFASDGMHHSLFYQGLSSFFLIAAGWFPDTPFLCPCSQGLPRYPSSNNCKIQRAQSSRAGPPTRAISRASSFPWIMPTRSMSISSVYPLLVRSNAVAPLRFGAPCFPLLMTVCSSVSSFYPLLQSCRDITLPFKRRCSGGGIPELYTRTLVDRKPVVMDAGHSISGRRVPAEKNEGEKETGQCHRPHNVRRP